MKMQQHEIFSHFEFQSENLAVKLQLDYSHQSTQLNIEVTDTKLTKLYFARLNMESLIAKGQLKLMFPSLEELFYYLAHHSKTLTISEKNIEFSVKIGESNIRKKQFSIELAGKQMKKQDLNELRIKLFESKFEKLLKDKDQQINYLKREIQSQNQRLELLERSATSRPQLIKPHPQNPDNTEFFFSQGANGLRVRRVNRNTWVNFISLSQIKQMATFRVKLLKLTNRCLCLGVGTKLMFGIHNYHEIEFVNYDFEMNQIAVDGRKIDAKCVINPGTIITVRCDPKEHRIWWFADNYEIGTTVFPEELKNKPLHLIAYFKGTNDQIQIWT